MTSSKNLENLWKFISQERHFRILIWSFYENRYYEFSRKGTKMILYSSTKFRCWKVFAKIEETSQFLNLKVPSFEISNPDSLELKWNFMYYCRQNIPLRFRKAGRVCCGGARETQWVKCHNGVTPTKTKEFLKYSSFFKS